MRLMRKNLMYSTYESSGLYFLAFYNTASPSVADLLLLDAIYEDGVKFEGCYMAKTIRFPTKALRDRFITYMLLKYAK